MRKREVAAIVAAAFLAAAAATAMIYESGPSPSPRRPRVVAVFKTPEDSNAFWTAIKDGVESGAQDFGLGITFRSSRDEMAVDEQIAIVDATVAERPAAILLSAGNYYRLIEPVRRAEAAGIKVVCIDSFIESEDADAKIGTDNVEAGQSCGAALLKRLAPGAGGKKPKVAAMSYIQGSSTAIGRETGLRVALGELVDFAETSYSSSEADKAYLQAKDILAREPELEGLAALNLPTLLGAAKALAESGRKDRVALVGVDSSDEVMRYLEQGVIRDVIVQKPFNMGYLSMAAIRDLLDGKRVKPYVNTGCLDIDKGNMFEAENQKLLFPAPAK